MRQYLKPLSKLWESREWVNMFDVVGNTLLHLMEIFSREYMSGREVQDPGNLS